MPNPSSPRPLAIVTGASSGIGAVYARKLASLGYDLILVARRKERLDALAAEFGRDHGVLVDVLPADLTRAEDIQRLETRIARLEALDLLVNNAGFGVVGSFAETGTTPLLEMIECHVLASVRLSHAALPGMIARRRGAIVNVSSVAAFLPLRGNVIYSPTKAFLNTFSEALQLEVGSYGIRVQALCPGFTHTEFHDSPQFIADKAKESIPAWLWLTAEQVVDESWQALKRGGVICIPGFKYRLLVAFLHWGLVRRIARRVRRR